MEKGVLSPSLIPQINQIARKIGKTQMFSGLRLKTNESVWQLMIFFSHLGEKTYSIMSDVRCYRLFHFDCFIANQMIRSTVHDTLCLTGMGANYDWCTLSEWCFLQVFYVWRCSIHASEMSIPLSLLIWLIWVNSLLFLDASVCISIFCHSQSRATFFQWSVLSVYGLIGHVVLVQVLDLDQPLCLLSKWVFVDLLK